MKKFLLVLLLALSSDSYVQEQLIQPVSRCYLNWHNGFDIQLSGDYAFVATGASGLQVLDVSDEENIRFVSFFDRTEPAYSIDIAGNFACVAFGSDGLAVIDISDPAN